MRPAPAVQTNILRRAVSPGWRWSADGSEIWYYDRPAVRPSGTWAVELRSGARRLVSEAWGTFSDSGELIVRAGPHPGSTLIQNHAGDVAHVLERTGEGVVLAPDERRVAYAVRVPGIDPPTMRPADIYVADLDGQARAPITRTIGGVLGWRADGGLIVMGSETLDDPRTLMVFDGGAAMVAQWTLGARVRYARLSPSRNHLAFVVVLDSPAANGEYVLDLTTGEQARLPGPSSVRWLPDESGLLLVPARRAPGQGFELWTATFPGLKLRERWAFGLEMESFDWQIRPDGGAIAYRTSRNLFLRLADWSGVVP